MVLIPSSPHLQCLKHLVHDRRDGKGYPILPAGRERYPQILVVQFYPKAGIEGARDQLLPLKALSTSAGQHVSKSKELKC
jgi:hypothetical protein